MNSFKIYIIILLPIFCWNYGVSQGTDDVSIRKISKLEHPRILLLKGEEDKIKESIRKTPLLAKVHEAILEESDAICLVPPIERIQKGRRLLDKSQEALRRIFFLSYAYRMTLDEKYFTRAELELLKIANFADWNPSHFLDVAEMTMAVSIGYDWLFDKLPVVSKEIIKNSIIEKGLKLSEGERFYEVTHNWNQVCNAGMTFGALAIAEDDPQLAKAVITRALESIHLPMDEYNPDGAYPEGYHYWDYGTSFNVMFLSAIEKAIASDFGLMEAKGFLETAGYRLNMTGATGYPFNYSDCDLQSGLSPTMFYFAQRQEDPNLLWLEQKYINELENTGLTKDRDRLMPALMIWAKNIDLSEISVPQNLMWQGQGANPVALLRTSWADSNAIFLGFKVGSASVNHGHMDIGSFVMEVDGQRWGWDLEKQSYESLESTGMKIFGRSQDADRWKIFRNNNYSHNTLTINDELQRVSGYAKLDKYGKGKNFMFAVSDLSTVYQDQLESLRRGVAIVDRQYVVIRDEITTTSNSTTTIRWAMMTGADVKITAKNTAELSQNGEKLTIHVASPQNVQIKTWSAAPQADYDAPNPGYVLVGFEYESPANSKEVLQVYLLPDSARKESLLFDKTLEQWK